MLGQPWGLVKTGVHDDEGDESPADGLEHGDDLVGFEGGGAEPEAEGLKDQVFGDYLEAIVFVK